MKGIGDNVTCGVGAQGAIVLPWSSAEEELCREGRRGELEGRKLEMQVALRQKRARQRAAIKRKGSRSGKSGQGEVSRGWNGGGSRGRIRLAQGCWAVLARDERLPRGGSSGLVK